ncbi:hypothetical protein P7L75_24790 [Tistrella mobilis]|uniref:hypothetical protein n=1 Tax=Tistrella mobilis TaxID=171437 RepID=UPI00355850C1
MGIKLEFILVKTALADHDSVLGLPRSPNAGSPRQTAIPVAAAVPLCAVYDGPGPPSCPTRKSKDINQAHHLLVLTSIHDGGNRRSAVSLGKMSLQIIRDWTLRLNAYGPGRLINPKVLVSRIIFTRIDHRHD